MTASPTPADLATLPPTPRPITAKARRRSWAEQPVRIWLILTALILAITAYFLITQLREGFKERWLLANGVAIDAYVKDVDGDPHPHVKHRPRNQVYPSTVITFDLQGHHEYDFNLQPGKGTIDVGGTLPIRVDPNDPDRWVEATDPKPWSEQLTASGLLLPLCVILIAITFWRRRSVLNIWRGGELEQATVVAVRHNATAPNSRLLRCHFNGTDRRVFSILVPATLATSKGEIIDLLHLPNRPSHSILAQLYWPQ